MKILKKPFLVRTSIAVGLFLFSSCTTVKISGDAGNTKIIREFGMVHLQICPQTDLVAAEIKCLGVVSGVVGFSLGITRQTAVVSSPGCKAIFWVENSEQAERIKQLIAGHDQICMVSINGKEE